MRIALAVLLMVLAAVPIAAQDMRNPDPPKKSANAKKSTMAGLSKAKLRSYLLEHTTVVPDKAWNAAYGTPAREDGENRETYIRRVLA